MPFGESFLTTIKNNKSIMLDKSKRFRKTKASYSSKNNGFNFPKATPEQLKAIRDKINKENKKRLIKILLVFIVLTFFLCCVIFVIY